MHSKSNFFFLPNVEFGSVQLPLHTSSMCQIPALIEFRCAQPDRCLQRVRNHGSDLYGWREKLHHVMRVVAQEIGGLISKKAGCASLICLRLDYCLCQTTGGVVRIAMDSQAGGLRLRAAVLTADLLLQVFLCTFCSMFPLVSALYVQ